MYSDSGVGMVWESTGTSSCALYLSPEDCSSVESFFWLVGARQASFQTHGAKGQTRQCSHSSRSRQSITHTQPNHDHDHDYDNGNGQRRANKLWTPRLEGSPTACFPSSRTSLTSARHRVGISWNPASASSALLHEGRCTHRSSMAGPVWPVGGKTTRNGGELCQVDVADDTLADAESDGDGL